MRKALFCSREPWQIETPSAVVASEGAVLADDVADHYLGQAQYHVQPLRHGEQGIAWQHGAVALLQKRG